MATESDNPNTAALSTIIVVGALAMVAIVAAITALVRSTEGNRRSKVNSTANLQIYRELVASQRAPLMAPPAWVDKGKGLVSIPIGRAETEEIKKIRANPWAATPGVRDAGADAAGATTDAGAAETDAGAAPQTEAGAAAKTNAGAKTGGNAKVKTPAPKKSGAATPAPHKQPAKATGATGSAAPTGPAKAPATEHSP